MPSQILIEGETCLKLSSVLPSDISGKGSPNLITFTSEVSSLIAQNNSSLVRLPNYAIQPAIYPLIYVGYIIV